MNNALPLPIELNNYTLTAIVEGDAYSIKYKAENSITMQDCIVEEFFPQFLVTRSSSGEVVLKNDNYAQYFKNGKTIFMQDFKAMHAIKDARINSPIELFEMNETLYKVSPFVEYSALVTDLQELADEHTLANIIKPLAEALKFMHGKNVHHGEISFRNIAKSEGQVGFKPFSSGRFIFLKYVKLDKKYYLNHAFAPEVETAKSLSAEIDIYAFGAVIISMMTGKEFVSDVFEEQGLEALIPEGRVYSEKLIQAVSKMCSKDAAQRPDGFYDLRQVVKNAKAPEVIPEYDTHEYEPQETFQQAPIEKKKRAKKVKEKKVKKVKDPSLKRSFNAMSLLRISAMVLVLLFVSVGSYFYLNLPKYFDTKQMNEYKLMQYKFSAMLENPKALYALGSLYQTGTYVEKNLAAATDYFLQASKLGEKESQRQLAQIYFDKGDFLKAQHYFEILAAAGDTEAQIILEAIMEVNQKNAIARKPVPKPQVKSKPTTHKQVSNPVVPKVEDPYEGLSPEDIAAIKAADALALQEESSKESERVEVDLSLKNAQHIDQSSQEEILEEEEVAEEEPEVVEEEPVVVVLTEIEKADKYVIEGNYDEAIRIYFSESEKGNAHAQEQVNNFYLNGWDIPKDKLKQMYTAMMKDGDITAQYALAQLIKTQAKGKVSEYIKAMDLFIDCIANDFPPAQDAIDEFYTNGWGVSELKQIDLHLYLAKLGNKRSEFPVATLILKHAKGREAQYSKALHWFNKASEHGHDTAVKKVASFYVYGWNMPKATLKRLYEKMRKKGDTKALYALGSLYMKTKNGSIASYDYAFNLFKKGAKKGHKKSRQQLDDFYENNWEMPKNVAKDLYKKIAKKGDLEANYTLGLWYILNANGQLNHYLTAKKIFEKGAKKKHALSKERTDDFYVTGWEIPKNDLKKLYLSMYEKGDMVALHALGLFHLNGSSEHDPDYRLAKKYFDIGSQKHDVACEHSLGDMHAKGLGMPVNQVRADFWHGRAKMHAKAQKQ
jgi:uncharacterized protein